MLCLQWSLAFGEMMDGTWEVTVSHRSGSFPGDAAAVKREACGDVALQWPFLGEARLRFSLSFWGQEKKKKAPNELCPWKSSRIQVCWESLGVCVPPNRKSHVQEQEGRTGIGQ